MTYKNAKTILFALLIAALVLPFSTMDFAEAALTPINVDDKPRNTIDSLTIPNAERDIKLAAGYELYPGVGWVDKDRIKVEPIYSQNPNNPNEMILDLGAMDKVYNEKKKAKITKTSGNILDDFWNSLYQIAEAAQVSYHIAVKDAPANDITYHSAYWYAPTSPTTFNGGTNFDFNAIQPTMATNIIFQPVLQHGYSSYCNSGNNWATYAFIYAYGNSYGGTCYYANEGDLVRGTMSEGANDTWTITIYNYNNGATSSISVISPIDFDAVFTSVETWDIPTDCSELQGDVKFMYQYDTGDTDAWRTDG